MKKLIDYSPALLAIGLIAAVSGCSMCCGTDDLNYGAYGGLYPRTDMQNGRVGSVFSNASATENKLVPFGDPTAAKPQKESEELGDPIKNDSDLPKPKQDQDLDMGSAYEPAVLSPPKRMVTPPRTARTARQTRNVLGGRRIR